MKANQLHVAQSNLRAIAWFLALLLAVAVAPLHAQVSVGCAPITRLLVADANNMHYRVYGLPAAALQAACPWAASNDPFVYTEPSDPGFIGKVAAINLAFNRRSTVCVTVQPVDFYSNGRLYCRIREIEINP